MRHSVLAVLATALLLLFFATPKITAQQIPSTSSVIYDIYFQGVPTAEISVFPGEDGADSFAIRKRNWRTNTWGTMEPVAPDSIEDYLMSPPALWISAHITDFPATMQMVSLADWSKSNAVAGSDGTSVYLRAQELEAVVQGQSVRATRWATPDGTWPLDLVIGEDNELLAMIDPRLECVLVRRGYEALTVVSAWTAPTVSPPVYGVHEVGRVDMRARDGARLATLVYLPDGSNSDASLPTILIRTPYGISGQVVWFWPYVARGYALVLQSTRGQAFSDLENRSDGVWTPMVKEPDDGADALEWITRQPWSDGQICMEGGSYLGYTQWTATMADNPALKCIIPEVSMGTAFSDQPYRGGGFVEGMAYYAFYMLDKPILPGRSWTDILHHRPLIDIDRYATGEDIPQWNALFEHSRNDEYWQVQDWYRKSGPRNFAALQISGWFDDDLTGTQSNWELMQRTGTPPQRLILGPWKHGYNVDRSLNGFVFGVDAIRDDVTLLKQRWYDRFLKAVDNQVEDPRVEYFVLGTNEWRTADAWPPTEAQPHSLYFHSDGNANRLTNRGTLTDAAPSVTEPTDEYLYDPASPPANWRSFDLMESWADVQRFPYDFKDIEVRPDVVTFTSAPLDEATTIAGFVEVELYASTDVLDTDWWVHLSDVHPDDSSVRLTTGMLRARFRELDDPIHQAFGSNFERESLLSGDLEEVVRYHFSIPATANTFKEGHRIRVAVMNALDNYYFPNSNTGGDEGRVTNTVVGTMRIHHSPQYPSRVVVHVLRN